MALSNLFSRRAHAETTTTTTNDGPLHDKHARKSHRSKKHTPIDMSRRPSFGQWLKVTWLDIVTMAVMGVIGLGVYMAKPAPSRSFPVFFQDGEIVYPQFAYPLRNEIVPIWAAALLASLVPIAVFLICQIRIRSFWDVNNATIGLLYSLICAAVFQVFLKWLIGGLRPHFLAVCKPNVPQRTAQETGNGLIGIMYDRTICTGDEDEINDALESFPSGHSTAAFAGFVFLSLYLNAKLKLWSNYHPAMWKQIATFAPLLGATLIAGALTIDEFHNWYDCLAGAIIGTMFAFSSYRTVYCAIFDWRVNHIPLNRGIPVDFSDSHGSVIGQHSVFTNKAGWGGHHSDAYAENDRAITGEYHGNGDVRDNGHHSHAIAPVRKPVGSGHGHHNRGGSDNIV